MLKFIHLGSFIDNALLGLQRKESKPAFVMGSQDHRDCELNPRFTTMVKDISHSLTETVLELPLI